MPVYPRRRRAARKPAAKRRKPAARKPAARKYARKSRAVSKRGILIPNKVRTEPGVLSTSLWTASRKLSPPVRAMIDAGIRSTYVDNASAVILCSVGHHAIASVPHIQKADLEMIFNVGVQDNTLQPGGKRFVLESYLSQTAFTNNTVNSMEVELYDLAVKKDLPYLYQFNAGTNAYLVAPTPEAYITEGICMSQNASTGSVAKNAMLIGSSPYDSPLFKDNFKVVKRTILQLSPGASHRHTVSLKPNYLVKQEQTAVGTGQGSIICSAGEQCFTLVFVRPYGAVNTTDSSPTGGPFPTTPRSLLTYVQSTRFTFTEVVGIQPNLYYATSIANSTAGAVFTTVNPLTGAVNPPATAP